jgi:excisionase family DNA binding protein
MPVLNTDYASTSPSQAQEPGRKPPGSVTVATEPLLDSDQAAAIMQIHPKTLQKLARKGVVRGLHIGKLWRFRLSDINQWIEEQIAS